MKRHHWLLPLLLLLPLAVQAENATLDVHVDGIDPDGRIAPRYALCQATADGKSKPGQNMRPTIRWSGAQAITKSYAVVMVDSDVPVDFTDAGKDGKTLEATLPRRDFYHWALVDIPPQTHKIAGGNAAMPPAEGRQLENDLHDYVPDPRQFGGPCPPWNDALLHHYHFIVLALNVSSLGLPASATAADVLAAANGHTVGQGEVIGTYTLNAALKATK